MMPDVGSGIAEHARLVIAVMVLATVVVGAGIPMVDRSTSLDQFQTDAPEADALDYVNANFSAGDADTTTAQVIVRDDNVLDKETLLATLSYQQRLQEDELIGDTLVEDGGTRSVANLVGTAARSQQRMGEGADLPSDPAAAETLDPSLEAQMDALESLSDAEVQALAARVLSRDASGAGMGSGGGAASPLAFMPSYYEPGSSEANATLVVVTQTSPGGSFAPGDAPDAIEDSQTRMAGLAPEDGSMSVLVFGDGIVSTEISESMLDSVVLLGPLALAFVLLVLTLVYRDLLDVVLGLFGIVLVLAWTFGAMGWIGIAFSQPFVVVLVLLIGLSIDYGLHVVMRYREARTEQSIRPSRAMALGLGSVGAALVYVTVTTAIGFLSIVTSPLSVFRQLGIVSAIGIVATLLVFGVLLPALKVELDEFLEGRGRGRMLPAVGTGAGPLNRFLVIGARLAKATPYLVIVVALLVSGVGAYGATQIDSSFEQSDFLAEDPDDRLKELPEPLAPGTYTAETAIGTLDEDFVRRDTTASILVRGDVTDPATLARIDAARTEAADLEATGTYAGGEAAITDPLTAMHQVAARDDGFAETLAAADTDGDGVPDRDLPGLYDEFFRVAPEDAGDVLHRSDGEYEAARMIVTLDGGVGDANAREQLDEIADGVDGDGVSTIATGDVVVNQITADQLAETAITSLVVALLAVLAVLVVVYRVTAGSATLGAITILPVAATLTWVLGSMALLGIPFNIVTGMITGLTIGLGVAYDIHIADRFRLELDRGHDLWEAMDLAVTGTGGALLGSAATTAGGFAVLLMAILPFLQSFGLITALTIVYAFVASVLVLPSLLVVWTKATGREGTGSPE